MVTNLWAIASMQDVADGFASIAAIPTSGCASSRARSKTPFLSRRPAIAILRLDTDWYKSTKAEFEHLYRGSRPAAY